MGDFAATSNGQTESCEAEKRALRHAAHLYHTTKENKAEAMERLYAAARALVRAEAAAARANADLGVVS